MSKSPIQHRHNLWRRFAPLFVASFAQGFVLWYAIEKLFMRQLGFDDALIGVMAAAYAGVMLLVEIPSGVLADRWSRKGVLMIGSVALAASSALAAVSTGITSYIIAAMIWGLFFALFSGSYDAICYDVLLEETGTGEDHEKWYGRLRLVDHAALVTGALVGGWVVSWGGLRLSYWLTVPVALVSLAALAVFREPQLHRQATDLAWKQHTKETLASVLRRPVLRSVLVVLIISGIVSESVYEFSQLWWIAIQAPVTQFGLAGAITLGAGGIGGWLAGWKLWRRRGFEAGLFAFVLLAAWALTRPMGLWPIVFWQAMLIIATATVLVIYNRRLHDELPSNLRSGASSTVGTLNRLAVIPLFLAFGAISTWRGTFNATLLLVGLSAGMLLLGLYKARRTSPISNQGV